MSGDLLHAAGAPVETLAEHACFGGVQGFYRHASREVGLTMRFGVFRPPGAGGPGQGDGRLRPALIWLAGLTCTEETFAIKAGAQRLAAEMGLMLVTPDTSPRATGIEGADAAWDFGHGAGFYLDATATPWSRHFRMESWITRELLPLLVAQFGLDPQRVGLSGHSMGGHGALTLGLRHPTLWRSLSAFAPIAHPTRCPWGHKAFSGYLGEDRRAWAAHDACELIASGARGPVGAPPLRVDQGLADRFLAEQLHPEALEAACAAARLPLQLHRHAGHDHGYYFIASFIDAHLRHHAEVLCA
jgi:S-formylglutathione hydrolase